MENFNIYSTEDYYRRESIQFYNEIINHIEKKVLNAKDKKIAYSYYFDEYLEYLFGNRNITGFGLLENLIIDKYKLHCALNKDNYYSTFFKELQNETNYFLDILYCYTSFENVVYEDIEKKLKNFKYVSFVIIQNETLCNISSYLKTNHQVETSNLLKAYTFNEKFDNELENRENSKIHNVVSPIEWKGTQGQLAELFVELHKKGWIELYDNQYRTKTEVLETIKQCFSKSNTIHQCFKAGLNKKLIPQWEGIYDRNTKHKYVPKFADILNKS